MTTSPLTRELPRLTPSAVDALVRAVAALPAGRSTLHAADIVLAVLGLDQAGARVVDVLAPGHLTRVEVQVDYGRGRLPATAASFGEVDLPGGATAVLDATAREVLDRLARLAGRTADTKDMLLAESSRPESVLVKALVDLGLGGAPASIAPQLEALARRVGNDPSDGARVLVYRPLGTSPADGPAPAPATREGPYSGPIDRTPADWLPPPPPPVDAGAGGGAADRPAGGPAAAGSAPTGSPSAGTSTPAGAGGRGVPGGLAGVGPVVDLLAQARERGGDTLELYVSPTGVKRVLASIERNPLTVVVTESAEAAEALVGALAGQLAGDAAGMFGYRAVVALDPGYLATQPANAVRDGLRAAAGGVLYLPDIPRYFDPVRSGGADVDLRRALARRDVRVVATLTGRDAGKRWPVEDAPEHEVIYLDPSGIDETARLLQSRRAALTRAISTPALSFVITDEAIDAAARVADRYYRDPPPPGGAIRLIHEAATAIKVRMAGGMTALHDERVSPTPSIDRDDILLALERITGIKAQLDEQTKLLAIEDHLRQRVVGQDEAIAAVADAIRRARVGLKDANRPIGSFIFMGPSGVGKTELAKALAEFLFDDEDAMIRLDMSEYHERHTISRLIGAPPGYVGYDEGGQLTEPVRKKPYVLVLFDEIEKAHPDVHAILLQIMDDGRLTDSRGRTVDFRNTVVIMTGNVGSEYFRAEPEVGRAKVVEAVREEAREAFRPEFLGRVDEFIIFNSLGADSMRLIVDIQEKKLNRKLAEQGMGIRFSDALKDHLARAGYAPELGARPLTGAIRRMIERPLSRRIIEGAFAAGDTIAADVGDGETAAFAKAESEGDATGG